MILPEQLSDIKILPVLTVTDDSIAVDLCQALAAGGVNAVEITLRTEQAASAIQKVKQAIPSLVVSAGTVVDTQSALVAADAGVDFIVSPGMTESLVSKAEALSLPLLPGVSTASEVMRGIELGLSCFKLFPAVAVGGIPLLKSLAAPLPNAVFCPTGGLTTSNFTDYLALPNVACVGGSWLAPDDAIASRDWHAVERIARETLGKLSLIPV